MDELPDSVLLQILSRFDDSAEAARCRVASKALNAVFPGLQSINLRCSLDWYNSSSSVGIKPFKRVFVDLISKLESVKSVCIGLEESLMFNLDPESDDSSLTEGDFSMEWLPRVSRSLKSLSISDHPGSHPSNILPLISAYCHYLVNLKLEFVCLSVHNMSPMPMLTSLILEYTHLDGKQLDKWFPNLQVLNLVQVTGLQDPNIHLLKLKTCLWDVIDYLRSLTLIAPNLTTFKFKSMKPPALHLEAPKLSQFYLDLYVRELVGALTVKKFENLKTLWLDVFYIGSRSSFSAFPITKTVETLTLHSRYGSPTDSNLTLGKVFTVFPNVSSLCIKSGAWSELEACFNRQGWEILDGRKGLKTIRAYLMSIDSLLTFSFVSCLLDQCIGLLEVSLFINADYPDYYDEDDDDASESFMSKCMARWPGLKWTWGEWSEFMEDLDDPWYT